VTVNGHPADIHEVDYLLRGVTIPAGKDRVVFTYDPSSFTKGWVTSLVATLVLAMAVVVGVRRRRRGAHERAADATQSGTA